MNIKRMEQLEHMLLNFKTVHPDLAGIEIGTWFDDTAPCGTVACILGAAAHYQPFIVQGLRLGERPTGTGAYKFVPIFEYPTYGGWYELWGLDAGREFFDLTDDEAQHLFMQFGWEEGGELPEVTPAMAAARVREMLAESLSA